jgi:enoyl-CoA hydratase
MTRANDPVLIERDGQVLVITINRPQARNAVDAATADALAAAFDGFERDDTVHVVVLTGAGDTFCAGADLREIAEGRRAEVDPESHAPMGPTWMQLSKPALAAVEGHAVAGGLELALFCDLRVAARDAVFGVFNRRWGVPLIDLGTVRLPRIVGQGVALDLILTGRSISAEEAAQIGLINRLTEKGQALTVARELAHAIAGFPQAGLRGDRLSAFEQWSLAWDQARRNEVRHGLEVLASGEPVKGAARFASGAGRHGSFENNRSR